MDYFVGNLNPEDDVRAVPLGGKRKRGRPKRNPHCLTRSPGQGDTVDMPVSVAVEDVADDNNVDVGVPDQGDTADVLDSIGIEDVANDNDIDIDAPYLEQSGDDGVRLPGSAHTASESVVAEDLCLQLEESFSSSDDDMSVLGADPAFNFKPPKKAKRDVTEVLLASRGRGRGRSSKSRARRGGRGRGTGTAPTTPDLDGEASEPGSLGCLASSFAASARPTGSSGRGRGRPRGSRGTRGTSTSGSSKNKRGRPRGS